MRRLVTRMQRGFTIIELVVTLAVFIVLVGLAAPSFTAFITNSKIRNAADNALQGLNLARAEAVRRNTTVSFQMVTNLTSACAPSTTGTSWVVSLDDPTGLCDVAPSDTVAPRAVQKQSGDEGARNVTATATGASSVVFNGLGRVVGTGISQINFAHATAVCEHTDPTNGTARCLRILVTPGGQAKLCDPKVTATTDPRYCS